MMEADYELAQRLQVEEQGELTIEERLKLFVELMAQRKKHFAKLRAEEIGRKPPTKAQKRNQMCTYLKNMANYKHSQLKNKSFKENSDVIDNTMKFGQESWNNVLSAARIKVNAATYNCASTPSSSSRKNKGLIAELYDWDEQEVSSNDNEVPKVKALVVLANEERVSVSKESARNSESIKISMKKVHTFLEMEDNDNIKSFLDYLCIDLNYHVNTEILKENQNLRKEVKEIASITEAWLNSSNKVNQCISEQIPTQKKKILGIDQLIEDTSSSGTKDPVSVKSLADNSEVSITVSNKPKLSKAEDSTLSNHDTVYSPHSSMGDADIGVNLSSGQRTIKLILKLKSTFKAETLKVITINEPSSAPTRGNKSSSVSKTNLAPAGRRFENLFTRVSPAAISLLIIGSSQL
ncbi:hypothetical protein Tco_1474631 [Tanacetum coccineum]